MGTKYATVAVSGYNATPPSDDGTVSESNKVKWSTIKTKLPDPLKTALESINSNLATHFDRGPVALITSTTLGATHYGQMVQVSGSGVTLTLTDAATLTAGWFAEIVSTDPTNSVTLARATAADTINETSANVTILPLQALRVMVNAAANGFLVKNGWRHSKATKIGEAITYSADQTLSGASLVHANASVAANATASDIWTGGNYVTLTGTAVTFTDFADAPQAGAEAEIFCNAAHVFTDNANLEVDGNANFTAEVGDRVVVRAKSTTVFTLHPIRQSGLPVLLTSQATTSGTAFDFTIPTNATAIDVILHQVSLSTTDNILIQIGPSGTPETTGYASTSVNLDSAGGSGGNSAANGFVIRMGDAAFNISGVYHLRLVDRATNSWVGGLSAKVSGTQVNIAGGDKPLAGVLNIVRMTRSGTDTFSAGIVNVRAA